jgi:hypothetical protein
MFDLQIDKKKKRKKKSSMNKSCEKKQQHIVKIFYMWMLSSYFWSNTLWILQ